jgi:hypothetical protein
MNINDLTIAQAKELASLFGVSQTSSTLTSMVGVKCIIRTYSAGVWFGEVSEKANNEVIVVNARRLWRWQTKKSISLSAIAMGDIDESKCRIAQAVPSVWLEAIELIPAAIEAIKIIEGAKIDVAY